MLELSYPKRQTIAFSNTILKLYNSAIHTKEKEILFDLGRSETLTPFGIIMLTSTLMESLEKKRICKYTPPKDKKLRKFFKDIGFNDFFNVDKKNFRRELIETKTVQLKRVQGIDYLLIEKLIELFDHHLNISEGVRGSLNMSLQEIMTNVIDHSRKDTYYVCAYTYPKKKQIRICVADLGIGIKKALKSSDKYKKKNINDYKAIEMATEEGVSSRPGKAGLGLNNIKQFLKINGGQMCIMSDRGKVFWKFDQGKTLRQKMQLPFNGTLIKLMVNISEEGFYFLTDENDYLF